MALLTMLEIDGIEPERSTPNPANVLEGAPVFRTWSVEERPDGLAAGLWEATPGKWRFVSDCWEYCRIRSGLSIITEDGGTARRVGPGDAVILHEGFTGTWEVVETTLKDYVVKT
ncbi:cupin domain-containing protein [Tistrella mobilis]|uniref:Cupin n=1 Tax=Tistrella mobilis TaxID=171437 RepID=A0A162L6M6_9PROT|nr:cupin domain-containing protein [Tistrella mobilis]KYO53507.1 cupin [Tistrella mobilis]